MENLRQITEAALRNLERMKLEEAGDETLFAIWRGAAGMILDPARGFEVMGEDGQTVLNLLVELAARRALQSRRQLPAGEYRHPAG